MAAGHHRTTRAAAVLAAAALVVPSWAVPSASADTGSEPASYGAYFYAGGVTTQGLPVEPPAMVPNVTGDSADGVAEGNLAVAASGGNEEKVSFLFFGLAAVPLDATIDKAVLTVPLAPEGMENLAYGQGPDRVRACKAGESGFFGEDGQNLMLAPERLCPELASGPGALSADGTAYVFDVTALAQSWLTANDGLALTVSETGSTAAFQIVFAPADQASLAYSFTAPSRPADDGTTVVEAPEVPFDGTLDSGLGTGSGGFDSGGFGGSGDAGLGGGSFPAPIVDTAAPPGEPVPGPVVAGQQPQPVTLAAAGLPTEMLAPTAGAVVGGVVLLAVLAGLSLVMGDPRVAAPGAAARPTRLAQALQARSPGSRTS